MRGARGHRRAARLPGRRLAGGGLRRALAALLAGYAADAIGARTGPPLRRRDLVGLLRALETIPLSRTPSVGLGSDVRGATRDLELTGLLHEGELIQMSAYVRAD